MHNDVHAQVLSNHNRGVSVVTAASVQVFAGVILPNDL